MEQEIWKDIPGYEGAYQASNKGRIKRLESVVEVNSHIYRRTVPAHICKQYPQRNGYVAVNLFKGGAQKRCNVHRLIAVTFIPNPECLPQVNHKDENKTNNCIENLEWCSAQYNINYGDRTRRMSYTQGKRVRVTNKQSGESRIFLKIQDAVNELNIPLNGRMNISKCLRGIIKSAYGYKWEYA